MSRKSKARNSLKRGLRMLEPLPEWSRGFVYAESATGDLTVPTTFSLRVTPPSDESIQRGIALVDKALCDFSFEELR